MSNAAIFNSGSVKILKDSLKFKSGTRIFVGGDDPTVTATDGIPPDVYISTLTNGLYVKVLNDGSSTSWNKLIDNFDLVTALGSYVLVSNVGAPNGVASLDVNGKLTASELPAIAITDTFVVASQAAQTALTAEVGDVAVRTDQNKSYILVTSPASTFANWQELLTPTNAVLSVFSRTGVVTAQNGDYTASQVTNVPAGNLAAVTVQAALDEIQTELDGAANKTLSNLNSPTSINQNLLPDSNSGRDLGSSSLGWGNVYTPTLRSSSGVQISLANKELQADGTSIMSWFSSGIALLATKFVRFTTDDGLNTIDLKAPATGANQSYKLPTAQGANTSFLKTDGSGNLAFSNDIDGGTASNISRITIPKDTTTNLQALTRKNGTVVFDTTNNKPYFDNGSNLKSMDASSIVSFINDGDAEGAQIFTAYADAASPRPVDGTGGSPNVTATISSTSPLAGLNSFIFTKDAANRQGQGIAVLTTTIPTAYQAKVLQIEFDYIVGSGTFVAGSSSADSDIIVYIYDVTNSTLIEPSSIKLLSNSSTISDRFTANFQTSATGTSYRLILHCATTSASAYTLKFDNIAVKPCNYVYGTPIADWIAYTPTFGAGFGTVSTSAFYSRKVGDSLEVKGKWTNGTVASNTASISVGYAGANANVTIDTAKSGTNAIIGSAQTSLASTTQFAVFPISPASNATTIGFTVQNSTTGFGSGAALGATISASSSQNSVSFSVPIVGWSSSVQVSDGYDGRLISASYQANSGQSLTSTAVITQFGTKLFDTTNSYNSATGIYTVPSAGKYKISASFLTITATSAPDTVNIRKNSTTIYRLNASYMNVANRYVWSGTNTLDCLAGDTIDFQIGASAAGTFHNSSPDNWFSIEKLQSPTTMSATERVSLLRGSTSGQSITSNTDTKLQFPTNEEDTHNNWSTSNHDYTVQYSGIYQVNGFVKTSEAENLTAGQIFRVRLFVDGVYNKEVHFVRYLSTAAGTGQAANYSGDLKLNAGQKISVVLLSTVACALNTGAGQNWVAIKMVK